MIRGGSRRTRTGVAYVNQGVLGPTLPQFWAFNPAYAQVQSEHVWAVGWVDIMTGGMVPQAAAEKAFKRIEEIFANNRSPSLERTSAGLTNHRTSVRRRLFRGGTNTSVFSYRAPSGEHPRRERSGRRATAHAIDQPQACEREA
jgi:hypothetical protein